MVSDEVVVFDNLRGRMYLIVHADIERGDSLADARKRAAALSERMQHGAPRHRPGAGRQVAETDFVSGFTEAGFKQAVERIKRYILDGDCMQVVISQRLSIPFSARPLDLYRALRGLNPSPYMYFLDFATFQVVGSSPEILVRVEDGEITVRPIAGTRRRGHTEEEDLALEAELLADPKERAEHLMLIDLGRNDTGRVAEIGSVRLTDRMVVERYSHVMHIVSNVTGRLAPGMSAIDVLRATFPAGTVSGAPKIRAMEIIDELEPVKRGVYSGAIGYLSWNDNMDTAIAIRTAVIKDGQLHIQAGAGIVADSVPELEWKETMNKGRAVFRAVALAEAGLDQAPCDGPE
jgi:anthranilate synthase component 1